MPHFVARALQVSCLGFIESVTIAAPTGAETQAIRAQMIANTIGLILPSISEADGLI
jgi:hypothetical protein